MERGAPPEFFGLNPAYHGEEQPDQIEQTAGVEVASPVAAVGRDNDPEDERQGEADDPHRRILAG
jgi:hypothetical protein